MRRSLKHRGLIVSSVVAILAVGLVIVWRLQQPPSVRVAAISFVESLVSCDGRSLYDLATPEEQSRYNPEALAGVCLAMRDEMLGGLQLIKPESHTAHAAENGNASATFRAGDGTEFECGADVLRYGDRPVGSVVLQMRFMVMRYIMTRDHADVPTARETFTRDYLAKFLAAGANEYYRLPTNDWKTMQ